MQYVIAVDMYTTHMSLALAVLLWYISTKLTQSICPRRSRSKPEVLCFTAGKRQISEVQAKLYIDSLPIRGSLEMLRILVSSYGHISRNSEQRHDTQMIRFVAEVLLQYPAG